MCVVVAQDAFAMRLVQSQRISDTVRNTVRLFDSLRFQLDPVAVSLIEY